MNNTTAYRRRAYKEVGMSSDNVKHLETLDTLIERARQYGALLQKDGSRLQNVSANEKIDHGNEGPYGGTYVEESPQGMIYYEDANPSDFGYPDKGNDMFFEEMLSSRYDIPEDIADEDSIRLTDEVYQTLYAAFTNAWNAVRDQAVELDNLLQDWQEADGDPSSEANAMGAQMYSDSKEILGRIVPQLIKIREQWQKEAELDSKLDSGMVGEGGRSIMLAQALSRTASAAFRAVASATGSRAAQDIRGYLGVFAKAIDQLKATPGFTAQDCMKLEAQVADLKDIAGRGFYADIRSWEMRAVQREDAKIVFDSMRSHWAKRAAQMKSVISEGGTVQAIPIKKVGVGQMVQIPSMRCFGKVLSPGKLDDAGKAIYEVRVDGMDRIRTFYAKELVIIPD